MTYNPSKIALWFVVICTAAFGDTLVVPNAQTSAPGNAALTLNSAPFRFQEVVGAGQFTAPILINAIRLRAAPGTGAVNANYSSYKVTLSTTQAYPNTANGHTLISTTYANNTGSDAAVVYNGSLSLVSAGCPSPGPCAFDLVISLATPFAFDPNKGRLLVDVIGTPNGTPNGALDGAGFPDTSASTVAAVNGDPSSPTGAFLPGGAVLGLDFGAGSSGVSLRGAFGFLINGASSDPSQTSGVAFLGTINFDGAGNVNGTVTSENGASNSQPAQTTMGTFTGTYTVNSDGTGRVTIVPDGGGATTTFSMLVIDQGQGAQLAVTNRDPGGLPQAVLSGFARAIYTGSVKGTYGFQLSNSPKPASTIGSITLDGAGGATVSFLLVGPGGGSNNQPQLSNGTLTGTYSLNPDGTGTVQLSAASGPAGAFAFVVTDGGSGLLLLQTDGTGSNVSSGAARLQ